MSSRHHKPSNWGAGQIVCIDDHEPWPCSKVKLIAEAWREIAVEVRPSSPEPMDSQTSFERWDTRKSVAEEIEDMATDLLARVPEEEPKDG